MVTAAAPAVDVCELTKSYAGRPAVRGVSLCATRGEILALLGPNGAGKTTTVEICEGFRRADAGQVRVLGLDPIADASALGPRVGVMLQEGVGGYTGARTKEMLQLFASYAAHPLDPDALLERVGLAEVAATPIKRLSGGQQQRLSLAMAVVGRPELVFLDEPTAGLDPQARRGTWALLAELRRDGVSVVLTTHYLDEAEALADRVVVLDAGRVVADGSPAELTRQGAEGQIRFEAAPGLDLSSLGDVLPVGARVAERRTGHYVVEGAADPQTLAVLTAWCAQRDVLVTDLSVERRRLEDVFLDLTGREIRT